jgi:hypothetical protein
LPLKPFPYLSFYFLFLLMQQIEEWQRLFRVDIELDSSLFAFIFKVAPSRNPDLPILKFIQCWGYGLCGRTYDFDCKI